MARRKSGKEVYSGSQEESLCSLLQIDREYLEQIQATLAPFGISLVAIPEEPSGIYSIFFQKDGALTNFGINSHFNLAGFIFPTIGESSQDTEERKKRCETEMRENLRRDNLELEIYSPALLRALLDQIESSPLAPRNPEDEDLDELKQEVFDYLECATKNSPYEVVNDNLHWSGDSDVDRYITSPTDILIGWKDTSQVHTGKEKISMWGWKAPRRDKDPITEVIPYGDVVGIVVIPRTATLKERKDIANSTIKWMKVHGVLNTNSTILTVDRDLLEYWKRIGSPFVEQEEVVETVGNEESVKTMEAYGHEFFRQRSEPPLVTIDLWEPDVGSHIGSPQLRVNIKWDDTFTESILIDWGWIFSKWKSKSFIDFPSPKDGITEFLNKKLFRPVKRLYRTDLLMNSLDAKIISNLLAIVQSGKEKNYTIDEFIALENYHRLGQDGMLELLLSKDKTRNYTQQLMKNGGITKLFKYLQKRERDVYAQKTQYHGLFITHAHQDHTLGSSIIRNEITRYWSDITRALLETDFKLAARWLVQETTASRDYSSPKVRGAYPLHEYPYEFMEDGLRIEIAEGIFVTAYSGSHSVPGELGFVWEVYHKGQLVSSGCYGGDDKDGHFNRRLQDHVENISPIDIAFIEGTNDDRTNKKGAFSDEDDVRERFSDLLQKANREEALMIVDVLKNNDKRLFNLVREGIEAGRTIVLSPKIAYRINRLELELGHKLSVGYESPDPIEQQFLEGLRELLYHFYNSGMKIWKRDGEVFETYEKEMFEKFGTIGVDDLSSYYTATNDQYLLIREAGETERKIQGIATKHIFWVRSSPDPFDEGMKEEVRRQQEFADLNGITFFSTGNHTSGHGVNLPSNHPNAEHGLLYEIAKVAPSEIAVVHVQNGREHISKSLRTYPELNNTIIHSQLKKPNPEIIPRDQFDRFPRD